MIFYILFSVLLIIGLYCAFQISVADFRRRIIPDAYLFPLMLIGLALVTFYEWPLGIYDATIGALFGYILSSVVGFIFDYFLRRRVSDAPAPIGMGDIKLMGVGGLWLGTTGLSVALIIACITGAIWARRKHARFIPFGPFFIFGGILYLISRLFLI